jgi:uncharacterized protein (DUF4415 family)
MKKEYDLKKLKRTKTGAVVKKDAKVIKTIRLDVDLIGWLINEADRLGVKYQALINSLLRQAMQSGGGGIILTADKVREIVRDELQKRAS